MSEPDDDLAPSVSLEVIRVKSGEAAADLQSVASEVPCTIVGNAVELATLSCSPAHLRELAAGFLLSSGFIAGAEEILGLSVDATSWTVNCRLSRTPAVDQIERRLYAPGCGKGLVYASASEAFARGPLDSPLRVTPGQVSGLAQWLQHCSELFRETGGVHTAAISLRGELPEAAIDDVARHCAVDKVIGRHLLARLGFGETLLASSGRISSDIVSKARRAGIPILVARGAPTHQAVLRARAWGLTLAGFARGRDFTLYSHPERVESERR